ncbi:MAG TPA: hypothetical protein VKS21_11090 [Spirochaetota bacterium]|nr:hypothetical protein [Spirochaetota bacterium]
MYLKNIFLLLFLLSLFKIEAASPYAEYNLHFRIIGYIPPAVKNNINRTLPLDDYLSSLFSLLKKYSKIPEFNINSTYGKYARNDKIKNIMPPLTGNILTVYYLYGCFSVKNNAIHYLTYAADNSSDQTDKFNLKHLSPARSKSFLILHSSNLVTATDFFATNILIVTNSQASFISNLQQFYTSCSGANLQTGKSNSTFFDLCRFMTPDTNFYRLSPELSNTVFISYKWIKGKTITNIVTRPVYEIYTNKAVTVNKTRNFVTYRIHKKAELVKKKTGVRLVYRIKKKKGRWE